MYSFNISEPDKMVTFHGEPFLHHLLKSGTISIIIMTALQSQLGLRWKGSLPRDIGVLK